MAITNQIDPKATIYIGVEDDKRLQIRERLQDLIDIPYLSNLYFLREFHHEAPNNYNNGTVPYYYYKIIDQNGVRTTIKLENFEITEIEPEVNYYGRLHHRTIKIFDKSVNGYRTYDSTNNSENFIVEDLLPLIKNLTFIPNWEIFKEYQQIPFLKKKVAELSAEVQSLKGQNEKNADI